MKRIVKYLFIFVLFMHWSCSNELKPDLPEKQQLVFYSLLQPNEEIIATLSKSIPVLENDRTLSYVKDALILLYENDILVDTLVRFDSVYFFSNLKTIEGNSYKFIVKSNEADNLISDEIKVLKPVKIESLKVDTLLTENKRSSNQDIQLTSTFDTISGYKYYGYSMVVYEDKGKSKRRSWNMNEEFSCSGDDLAEINDVTIAYIGCLEELHKVKLITRNYNLSDIDSIKFIICKMPNLSGEIINQTALANFAFIAPNDVLLSNISGGYGAVLTMSCTEKTIKLK